MHSRREKAQWIGIAAALLAGAMVWCSSSWSRAVIGDTAGRLWNRKPWEEARIYLDWTKPEFRRDPATLPPDIRIALTGSDTERRTHALGRLDNVGYLWKWWNLTYFAENEPYPHYKLNHIAVLADLPEEVRRQAALFREKMHFLQGHDPENGYPLAMLALVEAQEGMGLTRETGNSPYEVYFRSPEHLSRAVELFHKAIRMPEFSLREDRLKREWAAQLGPAATFREVMQRELLMREAEIFHVGIWVLQYFLMTEAGLRLDGAVRDDTVESLDILLDIQTLWARTLLDAPFAESWFYHLIARVTRQGAAMLDAAGRTEDAGILIKRGRELARPYLLAESHGGLADDVLSDAGLDEERRLLQAWLRENPDPVASRTRTKEFGMYQNIADFRLAQPFKEFTATPEQLEDLVRFELWGVAKVLWHGTLLLAWSALAGTTILTLARLFFARKGEDTGFRADASVPGPSGIIPAIITFGIFAPLPGLLGAWTGPERFMANASLHIFFLTIWAWVASLVGIGLWTRRASPLRRPERWIAAIAILGLLAAPPLAYATYLSRPVPIMPRYPAIFLTLSPALFWGLLWLAHEIRLAASRKPVGREERSRRLFHLAAMAGAFLLWCGATAVIDWKERSYGHSETLRSLLLPPEFPHNRITALHALRIRQILDNDPAGREEASITTCGPGSTAQVNGEGYFFPANGCVTAVNRRVKHDRGTHGDR